jgi:exodeoxyribonuclease VII small subunit
MESLKQNHKFISMSSLSYEEAYKKLAEIAKSIESENISVDVLAEKVKEAAALIEICQTKLRSTETEVNKIIAQLSNGGK